MRRFLSLLLVASALVVIPARTAMADPLSPGCQDVNEYFSSGPKVGFNGIEFTTESFSIEFAEGEVVTLAVSDWSVPNDEFTLAVEGTPVATRLTPGALSYRVTVARVYDVIWGRLLAGSGTWTGFCSAEQTIDPGAIVSAVEGLELPNGLKTVS